MRPAAAQLARRVEYPAPHAFLDMRAADLGLVEPDDLAFLDHRPFFGRLVEFLDRLRPLRPVDLEEVAGVAIQRDHRILAVPVIGIQPDDLPDAVEIEAFDRARHVRQYSQAAHRAAARKRRSLVARSAMPVIQPRAGVAGIGKVRRILGIFERLEHGIDAGHRRAAPSPRAHLSQQAWHRRSPSITARAGNAPHWLQCCVSTRSS